MIKKRFNFETIDDVKKANKENGYKWFSEDIFLRYNVKIETPLLKKGYFIISDKKNKNKSRKYTICLVVNNKGRVVTFAKRCFSNVKEAKTKIKEYYEKRTGVGSMSDSYIDWSVLPECKNDKNEF